MEVILFKMSELSKSSRQRISWHTVDSDSAIVRDLWLELLCYFFSCLLPETKQIFSASHFRGAVSPSKNWSLLLKSCMLPPQVMDAPPQVMYAPPQRKF